MPEPFLHPRGNYRNLIGFQKAECVYDITLHFINTFISRGDRTFDQMKQAARSGKQNIVEGVSDSATSKEMEIKLIGVAIGSLQELLADYEDYLRNREMVIYGKDSDEGRKLRQFCYKRNDSVFYREYIKGKPDWFIANIAMTLIHQADYLLGRYLQRIQVDFLTEGGVREQMTRARINYRNGKG